MKYSKKTKILNRFIYFLVGINIILSCIYIIRFTSLSQEGVEESNLLNTIELDNTIQQGKEKNETSEENTLQSPEITQEEQKANQESSERMAKVEKMQEINEDIVGWIEIKDTNINYPVLQGEDNEYYLTHNYKKNKSQKGSIFLTKDYDWSIPSNNLLIYGHNIINGQMFRDLLKYKDEEFYNEHPIIRFTTENEDSEYEIMSAFKSRVYYKEEENVFRYYNFVNPKTEEEYNEFVENAQKASLYDTNVEAKYGDELITLITCSYHTEDGRFVVIGRKR